MLAKGIKRLFKESQITCFIVISSKGNSGKSMKSAKNCKFQKFDRQSSEGVSAKGLYPLSAGGLSFYYCIIYFFSY